MLSAFPKIPIGFNKSALTKTLADGFGNEGGRHPKAVGLAAKLRNQGLRGDPLHSALQAANDAGDTPLPAGELADIAAWGDRLEDDEFRRSEAGKILRDSRHNVEYAISQLGVALSRNSFSGRSLLDGKPIDDEATRRLWFAIEERFRFRPTKDFFWEVVQDIAAQNAFDPVCDHIEEIQGAWDGISRLDSWLSDHCGSEDTPYTRAVGCIMLIGAVRRARQPGCKFDTMPVLVGSQGCGKSSAVRILAGDDEWFADHVPFNADAREVVEALSGHWFVEAGELHGLGKAGAERLKSFLSRQHDIGRAAFGRMSQSTPRRCVFVGTTNAATFLTDGTGNRRFLPVEVGTIDLEALSRDRDQLMGEAAAREAAGEAIFLPADLWAVAAEEQDARRIESPIVSLLQEHLDGHTGRIRSTDVWELLKIPVSQQQSIAGLVSSAMQELGWKPSRYRFGRDKTLRGYAKGTEFEQRDVLTTSHLGIVGPQDSIKLRIVS